MTMLSRYVPWLIVVVIIGAEIYAQTYDAPLVGRYTLLGCLLGLVLASSKLEILLYQLQDQVKDLERRPSDPASERSTLMT